MKGHIKGKWLARDQIVSLPPSLEEGDSLVLRIGKFSGVGTVRRKDEAQAIRIKDVTQRDFVLSDRPTTLKDTIQANAEHLKRLERLKAMGLPTRIVRDTK